MPELLFDYAFLRREASGVIRVHALAFERKLAATIPIGHAVLTWIVEAVSDMITKHLRGQDGRTAFERLYGKPAREEAF